MSWLDWFGYHHRNRGGIRRRVNILEDRMGDIKDQVDALVVKVTEYNEDVTAALKKLTDAIGTNPPGPIRDALVALEAAVGAGVSIVGDADEDGNPVPPPPPVEPPVEPTPI